MKVQAGMAVAALVLMLPLAGCNSPQEQRAAAGGVIGAGAGALAGQAIGGDTRSTLVGAAAGGIAGATLGAATTPPQHRVNCRFQRPDGSTFLAPCPR